jgi:hypothetical protein
VSWCKVRQWRDALSRVDAADLGTGLSPEGAREAWQVALEALSDEALDSAAARRGAPYHRATFVAARTVFTAPIEWCAVLLGRGTEVTLKVAAESDGTGRALVHAAANVGLPLALSTERGAVEGAELVVAMGSDETMSALAASIAPAQVLDTHGHRFSVAWVTGEATDDPWVPEDFRDPWGSVAADLALHDGRGCLSPVAVFTPLPIEAAAISLAAAMARAEARWPVGRVGPGEWGLARSRGSLARVTGFEVPAGRGAVHALPLRFFEPASFPRHVALFHAPDARALVEVLEPWKRWLSTVGTNRVQDVTTLQQLGPIRICATGRMQRPALVRVHDGRDWVGDTLRAHR